MLQIIYFPTKEEDFQQLENFVVLSSLSELFELIQYNNVSFLGIPATIDGIEIVEYLIDNKVKIDTVFIYEYSDFLSKLKVFFMLAKGYSDLNFKSNIIMKHELLDDIIKKIKIT